MRTPMLMSSAAGLYLGNPSANGGNQPMTNAATSYPQHATHGLNRPGASFK